MENAEKGQPGTPTAGPGPGQQLAFGSPFEAPAEDTCCGAAAGGEPAGPARAPPRDATAAADAAARRLPSIRTSHQHAASDLLPAGSSDADLAPAQPVWGWLQPGRPGLPYVLLQGKGVAVGALPLYFLAQIRLAGWAGAARCSRRAREAVQSTATAAWEHQRRCARGATKGRQSFQLKVGAACAGRGKEMYEAKLPLLLPPSQPGTPTSGGAARRHASAEEARCWAAGTICEQWIAAGAGGREPSGWWRCCFARGCEGRWGFCSAPLLVACKSWLPAARLRRGSPRARSGAGRRQKASAFIEVADGRVSRLHCWVKPGAGGGAVLEVRACARWQ